MNNLNLYSKVLKKNYKTTRFDFKANKFKRDMASSTGFNFTNPSGKELANS